MYEELWVGGKCAYKVESVVADDARRGMQMNASSDRA
jgi:hypothetical protein